MKPEPALPRYLSIRTSALGDRLVQFLLARGIGDQTVLLGFAVLVGILAGGAILLFYRTIDLAARLDASAMTWLSVPRAATAIAALALGLGVSRLLVHFGTGDSAGENIPDVIHAVARRGGIVRTTPVLVKTLAAAATLGSGGSLGAEGPVAVLGAAVGSRAGRYFRFRPERLRLLVGCGATAGISGAFGAPIAGLFFALEKLVGGLRATALAPLVVASVAAAAVTRVGLGADQVIRIPTEYSPRSTRELLLYGLVGALAGVVSVVYSRGVWRMQDLLTRWPWWLRLGVAAVLIGAVSALFAPALWGRGHQGLDLGLVRTVGPAVLFALCVAKIGATALTLSGGGVGGVFTPALVIGGTFGAACGQGLSLLFPSMGLDPVPFGLVGMTAVVSGSMHAPLTAIFMVLEMTNDYALVLPLMLGGSLAWVVARALHPESIYSEWLTRRGEQIHHGTDQKILERLLVSAAYRTDVTSLQARWPLAEGLAVARRSSQLEFPVVDADGVVVGVFPWDALRDALAETDLPPDTTVESRSLPFSEGVTPQDTLLTAIRRMGARGSQMLPVVAPDGSGRLLGMIGRHEVFSAYERATD